MDATATTSHKSIVILVAHSISVKIVVKYKKIEGVTKFFVYLYAMKVLGTCTKVPKHVQKKTFQIIGADLTETMKAIHH